MGISKQMPDGPIVGIAITPSDLNNCHRGMPKLVEAVSNGVLAAGALPRTFPTISLGEVFLKPTSMVYRNLMSMDTEEMISAQPMDAVVMIGGCDKTVPAQLMGAASANRPTIQLVTGPCQLVVIAANVWAPVRIAAAFGVSIAIMKLTRMRFQPSKEVIHDLGCLRGDGHGEYHGLYR